MRYPAVLIVCLLLLSCAGAGPADYDVVLAGGRIVDGSGNSWFHGDVAIKGDTIAAVGQFGKTNAKLRIDASGLIVAPGFIDIHSHGRRGIFETPEAENYIRQGVTTIIEGPDGGSPLPVGPFLEKVGQTPLAVNFGLFVGQGTIREKVVGLENRRATAEEIQQMKEMVEDAMRQGAFGISTGLFYLPGSFTPTEEVIELARVAGRLGGIHISHIRDEAGGIADSVRETIRIGEEGGLPTQVTHHKVIGRDNWGRSVETLRLVQEARERGVDVTLDQYPYTATSTGTSVLFPHWAREGGHAKLLERLSDPGLRPKIKAAVVSNILTDRGGGDPKNIVMASCSFAPELAGKDLGAITQERGLAVTVENAAETAIEIQTQGGCSAVYHAVSEEDVERIMQAPFTMVASDGGIPRFGVDVPHPRNYGTFARVLGRYVRERKILSLEEAVQKMSSLPANRLGLFDRGLLRPGMKADIAVFDAGTVTDKATFIEPHQYSVGFHHVLVNGEPVLRDGKMTAQRPGRVIRGPDQLR